jgi:hypothetical protein
VGAPFRVQYDEGSELARVATLAKLAGVAVVVAGNTWRDEGEFVDPGGDGPWNAHFPRKPPTPEDEPAARRVAEMQAALGAAGAGIGVEHRPADGFHRGVV